MSRPARSVPSASATASAPAAASPPAPTTRPRASAPSTSAPADGSSGGPAAPGGSSAAVSSSSPPSSSASASRVRLARRACDSCKVRKIRCSELPPCHGCVASGIECTFNRLQGTRGPRGLRARTIAKIERRSRGEPPETPAAGAAGAAPPETAAAEGAAADAHASPTPEQETAHLVGLLSIYAERLFPIWPILDAADLRRRLLAATALDQDQDRPARQLAAAVALATAAQLKLEAPWPQQQQQWLEQAAGGGLADTPSLLDSLRISFFLHIYHENAASGGAKSLVYLREAITQAQILRLDREVTYGTLSPADQHVSRRVLWLLFVTERGVALLHKLPIVLKPNILFPWFGGADDQAEVLPAFLKLVHLFWVFDQSGIFEILRNADSDVPDMAGAARSCLEILQQKLQDSAAGDDDDADDSAGPGARGPDSGPWGRVSDVQRADISATRQWMRAVLWRAALRFGIVIPSMSPVGIAHDFVALVSRLPTTALESHGPTLEFKTFEIATAVIDAVASNHPAVASDNPGPILRRLRDMLSSSRGGNSTLLALLNMKMDAAGGPGLLGTGPEALMPSDGNITNNNNNNDSLAVLDVNYHQLNPQNHSHQQLSEWPADLLAGLGTNKTGAALPTYQFMEEQAAQISWPPLDLGYLVRSPSPLTRMLLESIPRDPVDKEQGGVAC